MFKNKKEKIFDFANSIGIESIGVCDAEFDEKLFSLLTARRVNGGESDFTHKDLILRSTPKNVLEGAKSVVVCLFPYYKKDFKEKNISRYATVTDYHKVAILKLNMIAEYIESEIEKCNCLCFSDTGVLPDRYLAYKAGLGFFGKNNCLINKKYGSFFFIGYIVTTCLLEPDYPLDETCLNCGACMESCPGGAIKENFVFSPQKCVSNITQLKEIDSAQKEILSKQNSVYGCDICQNVCPHNQGLKDTFMKEFAENKISGLDYENLKEMSNNEFKRKYKNFAFSWRGKDVILKNFIGGTYVKQRKNNG